jgi:hypothetical protein
MTDAFDVSLLSQVQALNKKLSISPEHPNLKRKGINEDRGRSRYGPKRSSPENSHTRNHKDMPFEGDRSETRIDITI